MKPIDYILLIGGALIVGGIIAYMIITKRKGKNIGCGCGCSGCPNAGACHSQPKQEEKETEE